jgi:tungstate transport system permease protein
VEIILGPVRNILIFDHNYFQIVSLSLYVSLIATILSAFFSIVVSSYIASNKFYGKSSIIIIVNTLMSLPPVVVGLILYLIFSASGMLGFMDILYSPTIMVIAQFIIVTPIIISLATKILSDNYELLHEYLNSLNATGLVIRQTIVYESRFSLLIVVITGLSRALSEVGAVIIVGGNIENLTRVMTTSIVLETSRGELSLALSLGITLITIALIMNLFILVIKNKYS